MSTVLSRGLGVNSMKNISVLMAKKNMVMILSGFFHLSGNLRAEIMLSIDAVDINPQNEKLNALLL